MEIPNTVASSAVRVFSARAHQPMGNKPIITQRRRIMFNQRHNSQKEMPTIRMTMQSRAFHLLGIFLLVTGLLAANTQYASAGGALTVILVNEGHDANPGDGFCATASGACTLRAALEEANAHPGTENIIFHLPGSGVHVMSITLGPLPTITDSINLDGTSQPSCAVPCIVLSGAAVSGPGINGLTLNSNSNTIKGFIITSWTGGRGIDVLGDSNTIQSNDIGFWPGNPSLLPNASGILLFGQNNLVGGGTAVLRNVISGNSGQGIEIANGCCISISSNLIWNNYIGTTADGTGALGNHAAGITAFSHADNTSIINNVISGNLQSGIELVGATHTWIRGNKIGTNAAGTGALGNHAGGIQIKAGASTSTIGGPSAGQANNISYNTGNGIRVIGGASLNNRVQHNSIYGNSGLGIDLGTSGVTLNDSGDPDAGPNQLQNFPVLTGATSATHLITGRLNSMPAHGYTIEFFVSPAGSCDPSNHGEGKKFIGSTTLVTNALGNAVFSFTSPAGFSAGQVITATATDGWGSTSEFSVCRVAG